MSIVWSLKKLFDPMTHNWEEGEKHSDRQLPEDDDSGDPPRFEMAPGATLSPRQPARYACRICGHQSSEGPFCPECLADTMKPLAP